MTGSQANLTENGQTQTTENDAGVFNGLMLWAAARCGMQYVLVPFLLPLIRLSDSVSVWFNIAISLLAIGVMARNIWRLWYTGWRMRYLTWSVIAVSIILFFLYSDLKILIDK